MDLQTMTVAELYKEHQSLDAQMTECLKTKHLLHDEIVAREQAAFRPGPAHLAQIAQPGANIDEMDQGALEGLLNRVTAAIAKKKGGG